MPKRLTIEEMHELATEKGGICLSNRYIDSSHKLRWQCAKGHQWETLATHIKSGHWCPYCAKMMPSTIEAMQGFAASHGGECLSKEYKNSSTKLLWRCREGHEWWAISKHITKGVVWCPKCAGKARADKTRWTIEMMQQLAAERGGRCLSEVYIGSSSKLWWRCKKGHIWESEPHSVKQGRWCRICAGLAPLTLEQMQVIAISRGGKCLSKEYINSATKLRWECKEGHQWEAQPSMIKSGQWCRACAGLMPLTLEQMQELAEQRGGRCLSKKYINSQTKLRWECAKGHIFEVTPSHIKTSKSWCPTCGYETISDKLRMSLEEIRDLAAKRGGICLSEKYSSGGDKILWRCKEGHEWEATPSSIKMGNWCPSCTEYVNEALVRAMFERMFGVKFVKCRPKWLIGSKGFVLELDGYNKELAVAFEYHGEQHFNGSHRFYHRNTKTNITKRMADDATKRKLCEERGIRLVEIPYSIKQKDYFDYIAGQCKKLGVEVDLENRIDYRSLSIFSKTKLQEMKDAAMARGGECLSTVYLGNAVKLTWKCEHGHTWEASPVTVATSGHWCPFCSGRAPLTLEKMKELAKAKGGQCLSTEYKNVETKLRWRCAKGHEWESRPHGIRAGYWCPYCARKARLTIEEMRELAAKRGGLCLSEKYINSRTKLKWQCKIGHQWETEPITVKGGHWCPRCQKHGGRPRKYAISHPNQKSLFIS